MSAINTLIQNDRVHLYTDAAAYLPDGEIQAILPKVRMLPHINAAMAMRGPFLGLAPIAEVLSLAGSFDDLKANIVSVLQNCADQFEHLLGQCSLGSDFEVVIAGLSETTGPSAYLVASHDRYGEPWAIIDLIGFSATPANADVHGRIQNIANGRGVDGLDPVADGLAIMQAQRESRFEDIVGVGGFAQLTTIDANGVHSRIIHRWPDRIGGKVAA
ncbi:MAG: hypothetical protein M9932_01765 [Xanthobacteraceae bacterium]|nr:hypothetical protein [Xanthobacteraceae bacterium]